MTIICWITFISISLIALVAGIGICCIAEETSAKILSVVVAMIIVLATYGGCKFYMSTASGQRALLDQKSELNNGINRTVTVYTANGEVIAQYKGKIDLEANNGGYIKFDYKGKRYIYYNCFVESISE